MAAPTLRCGCTSVCVCGASASRPHNLWGSPPCGHAGCATRVPSSSDNKLPVADNWCRTHVKVSKFTYMWTIKNFSFLHEKAGEKLISPTFSSGVTDDFKWRLDLYPNGRDIIVDERVYLSLFLVLVSCKKSQVQARFKFCILNAKGKETNKIFTRAHRFQEGTKSGRGYKNFIRRDILLNKANGLLPNDNLTLLCEVHFSTGRENITSESNAEEIKIPECHLSDDLRMLLENQHFSDVVLSVNGREFHAHKAILAARSPVFAAMFVHEMEERISNRVEIADVESEIMREMLHFIYTGKTTNLEQIAGDLLRAADKYSLEMLKRKCEKALCTNLSPANAIDTLILADLHICDHLKTQAIDYINTHAGDVVETKGWKSMMMSHPHLVTETFLAAQHTPNEPPRKRVKRAQVQVEPVIIDDWFLVE